jgi:hypothetical protein
MLPSAETAVTTPAAYILSVCSGEKGKRIRVKVRE